VDKYLGISHGIGYCPASIYDYFYDIFYDRVEYFNLLLGFSILHFGEAAEYQLDSFIGYLIAISNKLASLYGI